MKRLLLPVVALVPLMIAACSQGGAGKAAQESVATAADALCRPTPNGRLMTGCYVTITTTGDDRLVSASTPAAGRVEIHESRIESGMMMMNELHDGLPLPAGQAVELKPGGNHIMLLGLEAPLKTGDTVPLTLRFATAKPVEIVAAVAQPPAS